MDFIQYLEKLKKIEEVSSVDYETAKTDVCNIVNEFVLSTEMISDKFKKKKTRKLLGTLITSIDELFETLDSLREVTEQEILNVDECNKYEARVERILDTIKGVDKSLKNLSL